MNIGVFGGTFDPPHIAHQIVAEFVRDALDLDCVLWVPVGDQPLKNAQRITPIDHRVEMVRRSTEDNPLFDLSLVDVERPGPHFTVDTLGILSDQNRGAGFTLILGGDSLKDLPRWHEPGRLISLATLAVVDRPGASYDLGQLENEIPGLSQTVKSVPVPQVDISSTEIRQRYATGQSIRYLVPSSVLDYIKTQQLYPIPVE